MQGYVRVLRTWRGRWEPNRGAGCAAATLRAVVRIVPKSTKVLVPDVAQTPLGIAVIGSDHGSPDPVVEALSLRYEIVKGSKEEAIDEAVSAPWEPEQISLLLKRALEGRELARMHRYLSRELKFADAVLHRQNDNMTRTLQETYEFDKLVCRSDARR